MPTGSSWFFWLGLALIAGIVLFAISRTTRRRRGDGDHYATALNQLMHNDLDGALESLRRTIQSGQASPDAYIKLGSLLRLRGEHMAAFQIHQNLTVRPDLEKRDRVEVLRCLVEDLRSLGRRTDALQTLQQLVQHDRSAAIQKEIAEEAFWSGEYSTAISALRDAQKGDASISAADVGAFLARIGERCLARERVNDAKDYFKQAIKEDPNCGPALVKLGDLAYQERDHESALYYWQKLIFAAPHDGPELHERLEKVYFDLGRFGDVERVYAQVLEKRPRDLQTLLASARIAIKKGESQEAESLLRQTRELDPTNVSAFQMLAELYLDSGQTEEARELIAAFVQQRSEEVRGVTT